MIRLGSHYAIHSGSGTGGRSNLWRSIGRGSGGTSHNNATVTIFSNVYFLQVPILVGDLCCNPLQVPGSPAARPRGTLLSCLFILLFIDAKLNTTRLHRIPRSLCYHAPTRDWVFRCLLSILEKANVGSSIIKQPAAGGGPSPSGLEASATPTPVKLRKSMSGKEKEAKAEKEEKRGGGSGGQNSWLNISMDAALGFRANVTRYGGQGGKKSSSSSASISVHPQAAPVVCRHTLEVLISLAKGGGGGNQRRS